MTGNPNLDKALKNSRRQVQSVESYYDLGHFPTPEEHWASQNPIDPADISRPVQLYQADWSEVTHADITAVIN